MIANAAVMVRAVITVDNMTYCHTVRLDLRSTVKSRGRSKTVTSISRRSIHSYSSCLRTTPILGCAIPWIGGKGSLDCFGRIYANHSGREGVCGAFSHVSRTPIDLKRMKKARLVQSLSNLQLAKLPLPLPLLAPLLPLAPSLLPLMALLNIRPMLIAGPDQLPVLQDLLLLTLIACADGR